MPDKKKRREDEDEKEVDEAEEKPRPDKKRRDKDADDDESAPAKDKKKTKKSGAALLWVLLGCGALLLCVCSAGGGIGGYLWFTRPTPVGKWQHSAAAFGARLTRDFEFESSGVGKVTVKHENPKVKFEDLTLHFTYTFTRGNPHVLETEITRVEGGAPFPPKVVGQKERLQVQFRGDQMILSSEKAGQIALGGMTLKRVK
jgi:hypothetical protein